MASPRASIIVRCYNEVEHIGKLLHGVFAQTLDDFEVILVDSGSTDGTLEVAREYPIEDVVYIDPAEFSFGRALNYGCEAADGDFCVFASAHVYPRRDDWLEALLGKFDEDVAVVYGKQRGNDVTEFSEQRIFEQWFPDHDIERQDSPFCNNANCAIRRELWEDQPYDEELTGLEDVDWAKRIQEKGYDVSYAADAEIVHVHDETNRQIYNRYRREAFAHKQIMPEQEFTFLDMVEAFVRNTAADYATAVRQSEFADNVLNIPRFRLLQFAGTYHGFKQTGSVTERLKQRFYYPDRQGYPSRDGGGSRGDSTTNESAGSEIDYSDLESPAD
jgi:glycosyltransferase involved in cell wall biosynthesis